MPYRICRVLLFVAILLSGALAAVTTFAQEPVLPPKFGAWTASGTIPSASSLPQPLQQELGAKAGEAADYTSGSKTIHALLETFKDPSSAYAAYTGQLQVGMAPTDVRPYSAVNGERMSLLIGNFLLYVDGVKGISAADLRTLALAVQGHADATPLPPIRNYLPEERLIQGTQRYAFGPAGFQAALGTLSQGKFASLASSIGFSSGAEAMLASYLIAPGKSQSLLLIEYPTPQLAEQHLRHIQADLSGNSELSSTNVERKASLLSLVLSPANERVAAQLRNEINYETQVTWNEPSHTLTDPPWLLVVKNIFLGTFAFCGLALVLGLAFGGVRVITKRLFPGKVFDRPENMEVLQLGLSGKRIDPRDFY
ncbi:MAG TPA: DUF6599 family protein [Candidatus Acidoferrum sp.]|nr:DUF6599 family protein [Candidatus Acidoferrum sp.]